MTTESLAITIEGEVLTVEIGTVAAPAGGAGSSAWGGITGTLSAQTDLQSALDAKQTASATLTTLASATAAGLALMDDANAAAQRTTLGLGTAAVAATGDFEASGAVSTHNAVTTAHGISAFGATLVDDADASTARTTLGLGTAAVAATGDFAAASHAHAAADITSGTLVHERGGLEADVSAYSGLVKIAAGATSAVTVTAAGEALLDDASAADQRTTLGLGTAATTASTDYATAAQGTDDRTASGLRSATTVVSVSAATAPTSGQVLTATAGTTATWQTPSAASGDVVGPASSTDNAVARFDSTTGKLLQNTSNVTIADTGALSITPDANATAITIASHTQTASAPVLDLSQAWNNAGVTFTAEKTNVTSTASAAGSLLRDWQVGGATKVAIDKDGKLRFGASSASVVSLRNGGNVTNSVEAVSSDGSTWGNFYTQASVYSSGWRSVSASAWLAASGSDLRCADGVSVGGIVGTRFGFCTTSSFTPVAYLTQDAAGIIAQRDGTNAQSFRVYNTYTDASNYERLSINAGAAGDWLQIAAETAGTGADNIGVAFTPSGTGAISAHVPDSGVAGGNARGANATDWQRTRSLATRVASGAGATISGGTESTASGANATVGGGSANNASGAQATIGGGQSHVASGTDATVAGGTQNTASGAASFAGSGNSSLASGDYSAVVGGLFNTASGAYSWVPGGTRGTTRSLVGAYAYSSGRRSADGDAQVIGQPVRQTTSATSIAYLTTDAAAVSATNCMVLPINSGQRFEGKVTAVHAAGAAVGGWKIEGIARRGGSGDATVVDVVTTASTNDAAIGAPTVTVVANAGGAGAGGIVIAVTPANTTTTYWVGKLELVQAA